MKKNIFRILLLSCIFMILPSIVKANIYRECTYKDNDGNEVLIEVDDLNGFVTLKTNIPNGVPSNFNYDAFASSCPSTIYKYYYNYNQTYQMSEKDLDLDTTGLSYTKPMFRTSYSKTKEVTNNDSNFSCKYSDGSGNYLNVDVKKTGAFIVGHLSTLTVASDFADGCPKTMYYCIASDGTSADSFTVSNKNSSFCSSIQKYTYVDFENTNSCKYKSTTTTNTFTVSLDDNQKVAKVDKFNNPIIKYNEFRSGCPEVLYTYTEVSGAVSGTSITVANMNVGNNTHKEKYVLVKDDDESETSEVVEKVGCKTLFGDPNDSKYIAYWMQWAMNLIKYLGIIALLIMSTVDFVKALVEKDQDAIKKAALKSAKRFIYCVLLFFLPIMVDFLMSLFGAYGTCGIG